MNHDVITEKKTAAMTTGLRKKFTVQSPQESSRCEGCPYPAVGFICWSRDGSCMKTDLDRMHGRKKGR